MAVPFALSASRPPFPGLFRCTGVTSHCDRQAVVSWKKGVDSSDISSRFTLSAIDLSLPRGSERKDGPEKCDPDNGGANHGVSRNMAQEVNAQLTSLLDLFQSLERIEKNSFGDDTSSNSDATHETVSATGVSDSSDPTRVMTGVNMGASSTIEDARMEADPQSTQPSELDGRSAEAPAPLGFQSGFRLDGTAASIVVVDMAAHSDTRVQVELERRLVAEKTCTICQRKFSSKKSRLRHEVSHSNVRPFACEFCGKSFKLKVRRFCLVGLGGGLGVSSV